MLIWKEMVDVLQTELDLFCVLGCKSPCKCKKEFGASV